MKRLLWKVVMLIVVFVPYSYADSFQITQVTGSMDPQTGATADNIYFTFTGPGTTIHAFGVMRCYPWCYNDQGLLPEIPSTPIGEVFVMNIYPTTIGGITYDSAVADPSSFFPPEGGGGLNPSVVLQVEQGFGNWKEVKLTLPQNGGWNFHFDYYPPNEDSPGGYVFSHGEFFAATPEPGTLGLMATGLAGITGLIRRKRLIGGRRPN